MEQLLKALKVQAQQIKEGLEDEIKTGVFYDQEDLNGREVTVYEYVQDWFFGEEDLVDMFIRDKNDSEYDLNDLRDLQHFAINDLSDIIEENQNARNKSDLAAMQ